MQSNEGTSPLAIALAKDSWGCAHTVADVRVEAEEQTLEQFDPELRIRETDSHNCCASKAKGQFDWKESNEPDCPEEISAGDSMSFWKCSENELALSKCLLHDVSL